VRRRSSRKGITLIEIAIVVTLIGILGGIAYPKMASAMTKATARSAQGAVVAYLARARSAAIQSGRPARMVLTGNVIDVAVDSAGTYIPISGSFNLNAAYGASVSSTRTVVQYDARGFAVGLAGPVEFTISHASAVRRVCVRRLGNVVMKGCSE
jgi:prepilin-type N-terminal cleavage/methylation domain-containing protein